MRTTHGIINWIIKLFYSYSSYFKKLGLEHKEILAILMVKTQMRLFMSSFHEGLELNFLIFYSILMGAYSTQFSLVYRSKTTRQRASSQKKNQLMPNRSVAIPESVRNLLCKHQLLRRKTSCYTKKKKSSLSFRQPLCFLIQSTSYDYRVENIHLVIEKYINTLNLVNLEFISLSSFFWLQKQKIPKINNS